MTCAVGGLRWYDCQSSNLAAGLPLVMIVGMRRFGVGIPAGEGRRLLQILRGEITTFSLFITFGVVCVNVQRGEAIARDREGENGTRLFGFVVRGLYAPSEFGSSETFYDRGGSRSFL